jgi:hypothetical protein
MRKPLCRGFPFFEAAVTPVFSCFFEVRAVDVLFRRVFRQHMEKKR